MPFSLILTLCCLLLLGLNAHGDTPIIERLDSERTNLSEHLDWYIDTDRTLDIDGARERYKLNSFDHGHSGVPNFGFTQAAIWFHTTLYNTTNNENWILEVASSKLNNVEAFIIQKDSTDRFQAGDAIPFAKRAIAHPNINFEIDLKKDHYAEVYLRVTTDAAIDMPVTLWSREAFITSSQNEKGLYGLYYGALMAMLLYNLLLAASLKDSNYVWYVVYIASFGLTQLSVNGLAYQYFWPESPWWNARAFHFMGCFTPLVMIGFSRQFLQTKKHNPLFDKILLGALLFFALNCIGTLTVNSPALILAMTAGNLLLGIFIIIAGLDVWKKGYEPAKAFVIAWTFLVAGIVTYIIRTLGLIPSIPITEFAMQIGSVAEFILLAIALSIRINFFKQLAAQSQSEINETLQSEVDRRTRDLENITAQAVKAKKEAQQARKSAEKAADAQGEFLATMSHEIRTPLNGVLGIAQLLSQTKLDTEQREFVETISYSGESLLHVINDILDFSKIEAGQLDLEHIDFDLGNLLEKTTAIFTLRSKETNIPLSFSIDAGIPNRFNGDPSRIIQILNNYLSNAYKFTKIGHIKIHVSLVDTDGTSGITKLKISVADTGIGIQPEYLAKLFKSFSQADTSISRKYGGTGLGLSICKKLSELMGGEVGVDSTYGEGSIFWFTCILNKPQSDRGDIQEDLTALTGKQIVIIGDDKERRLTFAHIINQVGGTSITCDASDAIKNATLAPNPLDLILVDSSHIEEENIQQIKTILETNDFHLLPVLQILPPGETESTLTPYTLSRPVSRIQLTSNIQEILKIHKPSLRKKATSDHKGSATYIKNEKLPLNILVAEDNKVNQMVIRKLLEKNGARVDVAENGRLAVEQWSGERKYDLIFMDCEMPEMDGHEATRKIREIELIEQKKPIKIVALSAHAVEEYKIKAKQAGMDDYITKPINQAQIIELLTEIAQSKEIEL